MVWVEELRFGSTVFIDAGREMYREEMRDWRLLKGETEQKGRRERIY